MNSSVQLRIRDLAFQQLRIPFWQIDRGSSWVVLGKNGSGKQAIDTVLLGADLPSDSAVACERFIADDEVALISFERQQQLYERELKLEANDALSEDDLGTPVRAFLPADADCSERCSKECSELLDAFNLRHRLDTRYRFLSTGESRKLLILQALLNGTTLLVLDNPFDGLDVTSCALLSTVLQTVAAQGTSVVLLLSNRQDIPDWVEHAALVTAGDFRVLGDAQSDAVKAELQAHFTWGQEEALDWPDDAVDPEQYPHRHLVALDGCEVRYGGKTVLNQVHLQIAPLQHTLITGANGSGKSTLLGLITGDCPQCYSNPVTVFGHRRGSGESLWDIKRPMGIVSNGLHREYRVHCDVRTVVVSGLFDSIGVYEPVTARQWQMAERWLVLAGLAGRGREPFQRLSYGEQRLALIARALIKGPLLLILDEPTQGLDEPNRHRVLQFIQTVSDRCRSTMVFVSHRQDEHLPLFQQHLHLS